MAGNRPQNRRGSRHGSQSLPRGPNRIKTAHLIIPFAAHVNDGLSPYSLILLDILAKVGSGFCRQLPTGPPESFVRDGK